jgi:hypothetical protein
MTTENLSARIFAIAEDELPKRSFGLGILGMDVVLGDWVVDTPAGKQQVKSFAILLAARATGPRGEVLLGAAPFTNAHVLGSLWPPEAEIRSGIVTSCDTLRRMQPPMPLQNGQRQDGGPIADLVRDAWLKGQQKGDQ